MAEVCIACTACTVETNVCRNCCGIQISTCCLCLAVLSLADKLGPGPHQVCLTFDATDLAESVTTSTDEQTISWEGHQWRS